MAETMADVVPLTASLVREYLSRKGLKSTLQTLDTEMPRTAESISNRAQLAKEIHIEKLMKKNKEQQEPFRSMLEVIVKFVKERGSLSTSGGGDITSHRPESPRETRKTTRNRTSAQPTNSNYYDNSPKPNLDQMDDRKDYDDLLQKLEKSRDTGEPKRGTLNNDSRPRERRDKPLKAEPGMADASPNFMGSLGSSTSDRTGKSKSQKRLHKSLGGPVVSSGLAGKRDARTRHGAGRLSSSTGSLFIEEPGETKETSVLQTSKLLSLENSSGPMHDVAALDGVLRDQQQQAVNSPKQSRKSSPHKSSRNQSVSSKSQKSRAGDLVFEDVDGDLDQELAQLSLGPRKIAPVNVESKPISLEIAMGLKNLIFGSATTSFTPEWRNQSFSFCDLYGLEYGIVQLKGGPCGVLAAVQGFVLKHLLFGDKKTDAKKKLKPSARERTKALTSGISEILWRAGDSNNATVALPTGGSNFFGAGRYKPDQLTEALVLYSFKSSDSLHSFISQHITQFESDRSSGCILLLYSVILSRSIQKVISDMDEPSNRLMGAHGYCTQEMVNLFITGTAVSNAFDNNIELDTGGAKKNVFKGLEKQSDVGLLSLFEHYKSCEVGVNFKTPRYPIWVICSESHFSVLFSVDRNLLDDWRLEKTFDLFYYDGLARQDEEIRLTVDTTRECPDYKEDDLVPPLELCIRTRWKSAVVEWNGSEPIL